MTKMIRVENADGNTSFKVRVRTQQKNAEGVWVDSGPVQSLDFPTAMAQAWIHDSQRLIIEEATASSAS